MADKQIAERERIDGRLGDGINVLYKHTYFNELPKLAVI